MEIRPNEGQQMWAVDWSNGNTGFVFAKTPEEAVEMGENEMEREGRYSVRVVRVSKVGG